MSEQQGVTVVVVENGGRDSEPYLGRPPTGDGCLVLAQHSSESPFLLDLRVRERLEMLRVSGVSANNAVLFWEDASNEREVLRRAHLVARKLSEGGHITFSSHVGVTHETEVHLRDLALRLRQQLVEHSISISVWFPERQRDQEPPPPLAAAWHRVQRFRRQQIQDAPISAVASEARRRTTLVA